MELVLTYCVCTDLIFFVLFCLNLERMCPWLVWHSLFWQEIKLCWKSCFSRSIPQSHLEAVIQAIVLSLAQMKLSSVPIVDFKLASKVASVMFDSLWPHGLYVAHRAHLSWNSPGKNTGVSCHALLQGIFLTKSNPSLLHYRRFFIVERPGKEPRCLMAQPKNKIK